MRTQKHDLKDEIKKLEKEMQHARLNFDIFEQIAINVRLENARSTLYNIQ